MNRRLGWFTTVFIFGLTVMLTAAPVYGQSASGPADRHHSPATGAAPHAGMGEGRDGGMMPMMEGCRQMMAASMMPRGPDQKNPKMMGHMMEMRGEMMKSMGEIMMKHGKMMQGGAMN